MPSHDAPPTSTSAPTPSHSQWGLWLRLGLSVLLAVGFAAALWPYLRAIPQDLHVAPWVIPAYLATLIPYTLTRAGRWHALVRPLGSIRLADTLRVSLAGYMWIALLPFRLGEFARPVFLAQRSNIPIQRALGTVAIERVLDGLVICGLFFGASTGHSGSEVAQLQYATTGAMAFFGVALLGLLVMARWPHAMGRLIDATVGRVLPRLGQWAADLSQGVAQGLAALPSGRSVFAFVTVTIVYWASNAAGMWLLARGCGLPIDAADAVLVMATMNIALLVPGGPAQLGIFQTGVALGLHMVLPGSTIVDEGSKFAFYLYTCQLGIIVGGGWWAQRSLALDWRTVLQRPAESPPPPAPEDP